MDLGLAYTNQFDGMKSMNTFDSVPVTLYADGIPYDLNSANKVTLHIGSPKGYVGAMDLDITTDKSLFGQGIISIPANESFMQALPPDVYYIEIWVDSGQGNMIFPTSGILPFTISDNLMNTSTDGVYSMTLFELVNNVNEMANIIENKEAQFAHDNGDLINVVKNSKEVFDSYSDNILVNTKKSVQDFTDEKTKALDSSLVTLNNNIAKAQEGVNGVEQYKKGLTETTRKLVNNYAEDSLGLIKQQFNSSGGPNVGNLNHKVRDIRKGINHPELIKDTYNQTFHFSTPFGWLNDIQTIVRVRDHWNIYYLNNDIKNKEELASEWYVAQTTDFKTFNDAGIAVHRMPNLWGDVFTGSVVKNKQADGHVINPNVPTDGYLAFLCGHTKPPMVKKETQQMYCAYSDDDALTFQPLDGSLVLPRPSNAEGFRDGKVLYNPKKQNLTMYMVQGNANDGTEIHTYTSTTGEEKTWSDTGILNLPAQNFTNVSPGAYECPNIIQGITDQATNEKVDVLTLSGNTGADGLGSFYIIGNVDDNGIFQRKNNAQFKRLDYGLDAYAGNFTNELTKDGSVININWIGSWKRPYPDFMRQQNNYHLGSFSLPRKLTLRNGILDNEIIEPDSDVLLHWYDTQGLTLHEKSARSKIHAKFNTPLKKNIFTFDYGDGQVKVYVENNKLFIAQPSGIFPASNGATCYMNDLTNEIIFYLDNSSLEIYLPQEKKVLTHMMLSNNKDVTFSSDTTISDLNIRQFNESNVYGSISPIDSANGNNQVLQGNATTNEITKGENIYQYRGSWKDDLYTLTSAKPGYYSLENNKQNAPKDFSGYGNVEVSHNDSDTFLTLKGDTAVWITQFTFGNWNEWKKITDDNKSYTYQGDWKDDFGNLNTAKAGIYAVPGVWTNAPKGFSGYGNLEVTQNESDTFVVLKSEGKIWANQYTMQKWTGWDQIVRDSNSFLYQGDWSRDLYDLIYAKPGYYSLSNNKQNAPEEFSGYGNVEVTNNQSDIFAVLKSEGKIWTNQYTFGKWLGWDQVVKESNSFLYHGNWTDSLEELGNATSGYYSLSGNKVGAPEEFSGYGNVEVTHNKSDTFLMLKDLGKIWTNQRVTSGWIGWKKILNSDDYKVENIKPDADILQLEGPSIYRSHWGYQNSLENYPSKNGSAIVKVDGIGNDEDGRKITVIDSWGTEFITRRAAGGGYTPWRSPNDVENLVYVTQIDNAYSIAYPGIYTHKFGKRMDNVPQDVQGLNDYYIYAYGGFSGVYNSSWRRSKVSKLVLVDDNSNEYVSYNKNGEYDSWSKLPKYKYFSENSDFNDITSTGQYVCPEFLTFNNSPADAAGIDATVALDVINDGIGDIFQTAHIPGVDGLMVRTYAWGNWSSWERTAPNNKVGKITDPKVLTSNDDCFNLPYNGHFVINGQNPKNNPWNKEVWGDLYKTTYNYQFLDNTGGMFISRADNPVWKAVTTQP